MLLEKLEVALRTILAALSSLVLLPREVLVAISAVEMVSMEADLWEFTISFHCYYLAGNNRFTTSTAYTSSLFKVVSFAQEVAILGSIKLAIQLRFTLETNKTSLRVKALIKGVYSRTNNSLLTSTARRAETLLPIIRTVSKSIDSLTNLRAITEIFTTNVAEQMVKVPLHHKGGDVITNNGLTTGAACSRNVAHHFLRVFK